MRLTERNLNQIQTALAHRSAILDATLTDEAATVKSEQPNLYGDDVRMVHQHTLSVKLLTPDERDEAIAKYESGMTMTAVADLYGCHYTTVGRLLRTRGVEIQG